MPSPIEMMIDKACGYTQSAGSGSLDHVVRRPDVADAIRCDSCRKHKRVYITQDVAHQILCEACLEKHRHGESPNARMSH